jgi:hypothetical protein
MKQDRIRSIVFAVVISFGLLSAVSTTSSAGAWQQPQNPNSSDTAKPMANLSEADAAAIKQTALDYIEGYYDGNAERMERALHPDLAKRIVRTDPNSKRSRLDHMGALSLVQGTRSRAGKGMPKEEQQKDVTILDAFGNAACVKIVANEWIDYLHVGKLNGRWVIVNVLWELKPEKK